MRLRPITHSARTFRLERPCYESEPLAAALVEPGLPLFDLHQINDPRLPRVIKPDVYLPAPVSQRIPRQDVAQAECQLAVAILGKFVILYVAAPMIGFGVPGGSIGRTEADPFRRLTIHSDRPTIHSDRRFGML
jgi:hypothetical protein